jgi:hypothetical protein
MLEALMVVKNSSSRTRGIEFSADMKSRTIKYFQN